MARVKDMSTIDRLIHIVQKGDGAYQKSVMSTISSTGSIRDKIESPSNKKTEKVKANALKEGKLNQGYYLTQSAKTGKPWFQNPKHENQYSEFVWILPAMAAELLKHNPENRRFVEGDAQKLARDILNENWYQTAESIQIDLNGDMFDGQHRAGAVAIAGKPALFYVTFNCLPEAKFAIDSGRKRSVNDKLSMVTKINSLRAAACIRAAMRGLDASKTNKSFSESEIAEFAIRYEDTLDWVGHAIPHARADIQAVCFKAALFYGREKVEDFCSKYHKIVFSDEYDPVGALYRWIRKAQHMPGPKVYARTLTAMYNYLDDTGIKSLRPSTRDIFEWDDDYTLPPEAAEYPTEETVAN